MSERGPGRRFGRVPRRPDHWSSSHDRARVRAAERLEAPLEAGEQRWLASHLAGCEACRAIADQYASDRLALRQLRDEPPEPPRDLWARTAAGIERESAARHATARSNPTARPSRRRRATSLPTLGALSGLAVVAVVVVASAISGGLLGPAGRDGPGPITSAALASQPIGPHATALAVGAGQVHWLGTREDGAFAYNVASVDAVCPHDRQPDCAPFADGNARRVTLSATPKFVFQSPVDDQAVVVGTDASGADAVLVIALPTPDPTPEASPIASADASADPPGSLAPASLPPVDLPTVAPSDLATASLVASAPPGSELPSPKPSGTAAVAILTEVTLVGRAAAYSADGSWFAFSARPADGSAGPDIYVWHVGDLTARAVTFDHASVFASWVGGSLLGSRLGPEVVIDPTTPAPDASPVVGASPVVEATPGPEASPVVDPSPIPERLPETFLLDPWTATEIALVEADWLPAVDPTGLAVVAWQGTVSLASDGLTAAPATGNLVVHPFHGPLPTEDPLASPLATPSSSFTPTLAALPSGEVLPSGSPSVVRDFPAQIVATGPIAGFDARWDETGSWLAIWVADPIDPGLGRLSLLHFDPTTGLVDRPEGAPQDVTALPGFSIGLGRLAWASPPGQGGEGSRIQIAAWTSDQVGAVESVPVEGAIVVQ